MGSMFLLPPHFKGNGGQCPPYISTFSFNNPLMEVGGWVSGRDCKRPSAPGLLSRKTFQKVLFPGAAPAQEAAWNFPVPALEDHRAAVCTDAQDGGRAFTPGRQALNAPAEPLEQTPPPAPEIIGCHLLP